MQVSPTLGHVFPRPSKSKVLASCPLFASLEPELLAALKNDAVLANSERGEPICLAGSPPEFVGVCATGLIQKSKATPDGSEIPIEIVGPGQPFGLMAVVEGTPYPLGTTAATNCWYLKIPAATFRAAYAKSSALKEGVVRAVWARLRQAQEMLGRLAKGRSDERLATVLVLLLEAYGKRGLITLPMNHQTLAEMAGSTAEQVSRTLAEWEREGVLRLDGQGLTVLDEYRLTALLRP